ncbi:MAG TPA: thiamine pyrophosphate-binding protein [Candidatus Limnocylindria bacterium]|nr:thiamine pyrophosphate-binding protein [Candidatus Limnocylindria bacterium]
MAPAAPQVLGLSDPTVARLVGERLRAAGVRYVTGHPGGEVVDLIEGFRQAGLEFILARHETGAAFMSEAMASATGIPGVCVATLGPGATNLVTGVAHAYLDRAPLIAFTGQLPADRFEITTHQRLDLRALFAPITKWQARLTSSNAADVIDRALRESQRPRRGPIYIEVPSDVPGQTPAGSRDAPPSESAPRGAGDRSAAVDRIAAGRAAQLLCDSERPVILVGMDANDDAVVAPLRNLAEEWGIPVMVSPKAKGVVREDHPLFLGTIEMLGTATLYDYIGASDLVLMIGFDPVEFDRDWTAAADIVHIGPLPNDDRYYDSAAELIGPVREGIDALRSRAGTPTPKRSADEVRAFRESFRAFVTPKRERLTSQQVLAELRAALPEDALVTCDVGYNKAVTGQCLPMYGPRTFFMSNGLSSMGYGLPAALGLKLVHPERHVACVLGDGGFAMLMAELETAVRQRLGVTVVVLADDALSQIKAGQERKGYPVTGTTFGALDYVSLAEAFGITGFDVRTVAQCREALRASSTDAPTLIAAHVDPSAYQLG